MTSSAFPSRYMLGLRLISFTQFYISSSDWWQQWDAVQPWQSHLNHLTVKVSLAIFSFKSLVVLVRRLPQGCCTSSLDRGSALSRLAPGLRSGKSFHFSSGVMTYVREERTVTTIWWSYTREDRLGLLTETLLKMWLGDRNRKERHLRQRRR